MTAETLPDMPEPVVADYREPDEFHWVEIDCDYMSTTFICEAPHGAPCRSLPSCQHAGGRCYDHEGNHADACTDRTPVDTGECVIQPWIENGDETGRGTTRIKVTTEWDGDWYLWRPADEVTK